MTNRSANRLYAAALSLALSALMMATAILPAQHSTVIAGMVI